MGLYESSVYLQVDLGLCLIRLAIDLAPRDNIGVTSPSLSVLEDTYV